MTALEEQIRSLEERLLTPEVRTSATELDDLLAEEFLEFGSSGRIFDKRGVIEAPGHEPPMDRAMRNFAVRSLSRDVVLATYQAVSRSGQPPSEKHSLRSSIWIDRRGRWQLVFHQGTGLVERPESR